MSKTLAGLAALVVAGSIVVPTVSHASEIQSVRVSYADLNLASHEGQRVLDRRITNAARFVCVVEDSKELALASATTACRSDAIAAAQPSVQAALNSARGRSVTVLDAAALIVSAR